jgi:hypothetical protein
MSAKNCSYCCGSGIVRASRIQEERDGKLFNVRVDLVLCPEHFDLGEKTMASMEENTDLPLNVVGVQGASS